MHDINERNDFFEVLESMMQCADGLQDRRSFSQRIAESLTERHPIALSQVISNLMTLKTWSTEEIDVSALKHFLLNVEMKRVIDGLCAKTPRRVFDAFCTLARSRSSGSGNVVVHHLLNVLSTKKQNSDKPFVVVDTPTHSKRITRVILERENLEDLVDPLSMLHSTGHITIQQIRRHIQRIVIMLFFGQLGDISIPTERLISLKESVLKIVDSPYDMNRVISIELSDVRNPSRQKTFKGILSRIMTLDVIVEGSHALIRPLNRLVAEWFDLENGDEDEQKQRELLRKKARSLERAVKALKPETLSRSTNPFELAARVLQFVASLKGVGIAKPEVLNGLTHVAANFSWEGVLSLCRTLAREIPGVDVLFTVLDLVEKDRDDEKLNGEIIEAVLPEETNELLVHALNQLMSDAVEVDQVTREEICKIYNEEAFDTVVLLLKIAKTKESICQVEKAKRMTLSGLLEIKAFIDQIASFAKWSQYKKKSDILKEIFFSFCTCSISDRLSEEALVLSKMALLLSLHRYTTQKFWKQKEALYDTRTVELKFEVANVQEPSHPVEFGSEDDDKEDDNETEKVDDVQHGDAASLESSSTPPNDGNNKKWFLPVNVPSSQLVLLPTSISRESDRSGSYKTTSANPTVPSSSLVVSSLQSLQRVESSVKDIVKQLGLKDFLKSVGKDGSLAIVGFREITHTLVQLKETTEQWCCLFEKAVRHYHILKKKEKTIESRVVCAGINIVFLFQFLRKYLDDFSLFQMPEPMQPVCRTVVHCLNAIPRKTLSVELRNLLEEAGATDVFHGYTIDFSMPPTNNYLSSSHPGRSSTADIARKMQRHQAPRLEVVMQDDSVQLREKSSFYDFLKSTDAKGRSQSKERCPVVLEKTVDIKIDPNARILTPGERKRPTEDAVDDVKETGAFELPENLAWNAIGVLGQTTSSGQRIHKLEDLRGNLDLFTGAMNDDATVIGVKVSSNRKAIREQIKEMGHISSLRHHNQEISAAASTHQVKDPIHTEPLRLNNWTYQLLLDNAVFAKCLKTIMRGLEKSQTALYKASAERHVIEWCLLVDNSGSMISKEHQMKEALVLVMEMLHRLEFRFAVALFGDSTSQRMRKLIKDPFTIDIGQQIIDSFTFDEGTFPASAVRNVAQKVWPLGLSQEEKRQNHRVMLMIVDGLTQERRREDYLSVCREKNISLAVLNIHDDLQKDLMNSIRALWKSAGAQFEMLHAKQVDALPKVLVSLMEQQMGVVYRNITNAPPLASGMESTRVIYDVLGTDFSAVHFDAICLEFGENRLPMLPEQFTMENFFECDYRPSSIPFTEEMGQLITEEIKMFPIDTEMTETLQKQYDTLLTSASVREHLKKAETAWMQATERLGSEMSSVAEALESYLPQNIFSRKRADVKGQTIHIPGYIKHLATQGSEKKIFANKKGGGKAEYAIVLLLDISVSMKHSANQACALETLFLMIGALQQMSIENFCVILFAEQIYPIKLPDMVWEDVCMAMLMKTVEHIHETSTMDADALHFAAELLESSNVRGPKKIFIVTDGYGSSGVRLAAVLTKLEASGIDVLAMSVGPEVSFVRSCYNKWIKAAFPHLLPNAIERMENAIQTVTSKQNASHVEPMTWLSLRLLPESSNESVRDILENQEAVFSDLTPMHQEREARLICGNRPSIFTVDICFCLDCTGSMHKWIKAAIEHIHVRHAPSLSVVNVFCDVQIICDTISARIKEHSLVELDFNFGMVAYRDYGDGDQQICPCPFARGPDNVREFLSRQEARGGGYDLAEDLLGGLNAAADLKGWSSKVKFCILIADYPAHGKELHTEDVRDR